jgi:hypothetical protein
MGTDKVENALSERSLSRRGFAKSLGAAMLGTTVGAPLVGATQAEAAGATEGLSPTAVKTSAYTAAPGDYVPVNIENGSVAIKLPSAPLGKTRIGVQVVAVSGTPGSTTVTINRGGSDAFNIAGGSTSLTLSAKFQSVLLQYHAGIWYVQSTDTPLNQALGSAQLGNDGTVGGEGGSALSSSVVHATSVKAEGAIGNGVTNDTAAIEAAMTTAGSYGTVIFPKGTYLVKELTISYEGQRWVLEQGAVLKLKNTSNSCTVKIGAANVIIEGPGIIDGNVTNQSGSNGGIWINGVANVTLFQVGIRNAYGTGIVGGGPNTHIYFCLISNTQSTGIFLAAPGTESWSGIVIQGCVIDRSMIAGNANAYGYGIMLHGHEDQAHSLLRPRIIDNTIQLPLEPTTDSLGIEVHAGVYEADVKGNTIFQGSIGISVSTEVDGTSVFGNIITNPSGNGIELAESNNVTTFGNTINGNGITKTGIGIVGAGGSENVTVNGNTIKDTISHGIFALKARHVSIMGNTLKGEGRPDIYWQESHDLTIMGNVQNGNEESYDAMGSDNSKEALIVGNTAEGFLRSFLAIFDGAERASTDIRLGVNKFKGGTELVATFGEHKPGPGCYWSYTENGIAPPGPEAIAVTGSPFTYTNKDWSPEEIYIFGGTVSKVVKKGKEIASSTGGSYLLLPEESLVVTYSGLPTMLKDQR